MITRKLFDELGSLQRAVMEVVWEKGEASVSDVRRALGRSKRSAYTTVLTVLQKLEKAGWVKHRSEGRTYIYSAKRSREDEGARSLKGYLDRVFQGDPLVLFEHLMDDYRLDDETLTALRKMIDDKRRERESNV
ncbi:MAG: BlaI/MecI/CopY family transcriptional regulator [Planctomycetota bacterium]|nr:BlaI/MecI/CopY family transcriptional regulator [Planctomycetota bacterium]MCZ6542830.1 BlaI/MecI/CopY family transcriptional regulator [Planctomycetota bacterium]